MPPVRIDLITSLSGISLQDTFDESVSADLDNIRVRFISRKHFVANKRAIGRKKDLADLESLGEE